MAVFKCKMCGGSLEVAEGLSVATCEYCGTTQTLPRLNDDKIANLYDRANHFRRSNDYDKAMGIYEQILNEDSSDSEAYWSLVLCRYGIEYVEDPATKKRIPTVNRAQFTSIFSDEDYKSALQYADDEQKAIYEEEAKAIDNIQKGILEISNNEEPFDVFICYKETDNNGRRTPDSVLANDLYHQLTAEGFKVFFAAITLEDKLGSAYEPYIFAALNSAKVMVVLGTKPEFFNAVWVKNEWSRYLALIRSGAKKMLIPAYKDMDPYDLPEEFSHLQAQDMSKLGFMQDLIRGIKKIVSADTAKESIKQSITNNSISVEATIDRAILLIEDGENEKADALLEQALNVAPKHPMIYVGKLMIETGVRKQEDLAKVALPFDRSPNYEKAVRFANPKLKETLEGYVEIIKVNNVKAKYDTAVEKMTNGTTESDFLAAKKLFEEITDYANAADLAKLCGEKAIEAKYQAAVSLMTRARSEKEFLSAKAMFIQIADYADANDRAIACEEKAVVAKNDIIYEDACNILAKESYWIKGIERAKEKFSSIPDHRDAQQKIDECQRLINELTSAAEQQVKKKKKIIIISSACVAAIIAFIIILTTVIIPNSKYTDAVALMDAGKYTEAISLFEILNGHKDSENQILECKYLDAIALLGNESYDTAYTRFTELGDYKDSYELMHKSIYDRAKAKFDAKDYAGAYDLYAMAGSYFDSEEQAKECLYIQAVAYRNDKNWDAANPLFEQIKDYKDSDTLIHYHDHKLVDSKDATCDKSGYKAYKCDCGDEKKDTISALGHNYSSATCTAAKKCSRCGKTEGSALGHTSGGTKCERCGLIVFKTLTFSGQGKKVITGLNLPNGNYKVTCTYRGKSNFWVRIYTSETDEQGELVANTIDDSESTEVFSGSVKNGYIEVQFASDDSNWTITIEAF